MTMESLLEQTSNGNQRQFDDSAVIEITRRTISFGNSVYQLSNVTGFTVGRVPKLPFPLFPIFGLLIIGLPSITMVVGILFIALVPIIIIWYFLQPKRYGFILYLNSGAEKIFVSTAKGFLMDIVGCLHDFMESPQGSNRKVSIDMDNHTINDDSGVAMNGVQSSKGNDPGLSRPVVF